MSKDERKDDFINPIDKDKTTENPGLLEYAHHSGSALIKPVDVGRAKGRALSAMYDQTDMQLSQIKEQIDLLARQAQDIKDRAKISEIIYTSKMSFEPLIGHTYYLYENKSGDYILSMIKPEEWGRKQPYFYIATTRLLADHTWEILEQERSINIDDE